MGRDATTDQAIAMAKTTIAKAVERMTEVAHVAVRDLTDEEIQDGFAACTKEAPEWTRLVQRVVGAAARSETQRPSTVNNSLQLVIVGKATTTESWQKEAAQLQAMEKAKRQAMPIDVPAVEVKAEDKK